MTDRLKELADCYRTNGSEVTEMIDLFEAKIKRLRQWVDELQAGMTINCVYCGHCYGPQEDTPVAMADVLREHIEQCPEHPLSHAKAEIQRLNGELASGKYTVGVAGGCCYCSGGYLGMLENIEQLKATVTDLLAGIQQVSIGLFGEPVGNQTWRDLRAPWWQMLRRAVEVAEAAREKG